jgi:DNA-binding XRE family transcriptional regulator
MVKNIQKNSLKEIRESLLMSKSELSKKASISPLTISRIEQGKPCRMETKRKILLALGLKLTDKEYDRNLDENLMDLHERLRAGRYVAPPVENGYGWRKMQTVSVR